MVIIQGDKVANIQKLNNSHKKLCEFIKSISEIGHRESYNSLMKKFAKVEKMNDREFVSIRSFFNPFKIHSICYAIAKANGSEKIIPYCEFNSETGDFLITFDKFDALRFEQTYVKSKSKETTFDPLKMINGLLGSEKYVDYWTADKLNSIVAVINAMLDNSTEK